MKTDLPLNRCFQSTPTTPVVMATCCDSEGKENIITLGMYMPISTKPPLVCIGVPPKRFSHGLIDETGEFVVNTPPIKLKNEMHYCGIESGRQVDKFKETGLTSIASLKVKPPRIKECFGHLECKVVQKHTFGDHTLFVGEVVASSVDEEVIDDKALDVLKAKPIIQKNHVYFTVTDMKK